MCANWGKKDEEEEDKPMFSDEEIEQWIDDGRKAESSNLSVGIYGKDGTGKSGIMMDSRTEEDIEQGKEMYIIDMNGKCASLKGKYYSGDENIIIFNPMEFMEEDRDAPKVYHKIDYYTRYLYENQDELNLHSVALDGVDEFQDICGDKMQIEDLNKDPNARVKNSWNWQIRNRYYKNIMMRMENMNCHKFFVTHMKPKREAKGGELQVVGEEIDWHRSTDGMLNQKLHCYTEEKEDGEGLYLKAKVEKSKGALELRDKVYTIAEVDQEEDVAEWHGMMDFWKEVW